MIIARSPLRISLGGGGTDLPSYYSEHEGLVISAAIDKYVYVMVHRPFSPGILLKYSEIESVLQVTEIRHRIIREVLSILELKTPQIEITSLADIPSGTGLGSSGSFTTALLKALFAHYRKPLHPKELAELACEIEMEKLKEPIGKQDQYIAAYGGITELTFKRNGEVGVSPLKLSTEVIHDLEDNLLLFFTGLSRSASEILKDQNNRSKVGDRSMLDNLNFVKEIGLQSKNALLQGDTTTFGELMNEHWVYKKARSFGMSNSHINDVYDQALKSGAIGGKLVGAGGGGFLMFYTKDRESLRRAMAKANLPEVRFRFDFEGTKVILS